MVSEDYANRASNTVTKKLTCWLVGYIYYKVCVLGLEDPLMNLRQARQTQTEFFTDTERESTPRAKTGIEPAVGTVRRL